jgi:hypothetical protein
LIKVYIGSFHPSFPVIAIFRYKVKVKLFLTRPLRYMGMERGGGRESITEPSLNLGT